jgi:hypothetical protein
MLGRSALLASRCLVWGGLHARRPIWSQAVHRQRLAPSSSPSRFRVPTIIVGASSATFTVAVSVAASNSRRVLHLSLPLGRRLVARHGQLAWLQAPWASPAGGTLAPLVAMLRPMANPSVKGTSRKRAAPYVER